MTEPLVTASAVGRAMACPASLVMEQFPREAVFACMPPALRAAVVLATERGGTLHAVVESRIDFAEGLPLPEWAWAWPVDAVLDAVYALHGENEIAAEVAFGWDGQRARELGGGQREYPGGHGLICGTADQASRAPRWVSVSDLKAGLWRVESDCWQLKSLAVMAADAAPEKIEGATVAIIQCHHDAMSAYGVRVDKQEYDADDLEGFRVEMRALPLRINAARYKAEPVAGDYCTFCPARPGCPVGQG